jgi:hypothetical protein
MIDLQRLSTVLLSSQAIDATIAIPLENESP